MKKAFENLETRRLFASAISEAWTLPTTENADTITISQSGNTITAVVNGQTLKHAANGSIIPGTTPGSSLVIKGVSKIVIRGKAGADLIKADNTITRPLDISGGHGFDTIEGGAANDTLHGGNAPDETGADAAKFFSDTIRGNNGNDVISLASNGDGNLADGGNGADTLWGTVGDDTLLGGRGNDNIQGREGSDYIIAGPEVLRFNQTMTEGDDDTVDAGAGHDSVKGGYGRDLLITGNHHDEVHGGPGNDTISAGDGWDTVYGNSGEDSITGGRGNDSLNGGSGNDTLDGGMDKDYVLGDSGNDIVNGGTETDTLSGGSGTDTVSYEGRSHDLRISLDGLANDGWQAENDYIQNDFENARGGSGDDIITGSDLANSLFGGFGNDTIDARGGADIVDGESGDDSLQGGRGADSVVGAAGNDTLSAGAGESTDTLKGGLGYDVLISVGGGKDFAEGAGYDDVFWTDPGDTTDATSKPGNKDTHHKIDFFHNYVSKEIEGQNLKDPSLREMNARYGRRFSNVPLFDSNGPDEDDALQGELGDCYFLAGLGSIARSKPKILERSIVDFGDGSYGVRFFNDSGQARYYRVDNELPRFKNEDKLKFAQFDGADPSMWVPIMEKAYAFHRTGDAAYEEIEGDDDLLTPGTVYEAFDAFKLGHDTDEVIFNSNEYLAKRMRSVLQAGGAVVASTDPAFLGCDLVPLHAYTVERVSSDFKYITIRNPWGRDDDNFKDANNDGSVTIHRDQFGDDFFFVAYSLL